MPAVTNANRKLVKIVFLIALISSPPSEKPLDLRRGQFAHAGGIMILTPDGKLSKYFYGIDYAPKDVKFSLMESAENKVGDVADKMLLYCYHYDPSTGKYGLAILTLMRSAAIATLLGMGLMGFVFWRRNRKIVNSE